ncbi:DUF6966 domain-containing protein [Microbacterium sp.]|uniref:DUF6966 domain-containing protein n=1 Tax=Microbacterium sp. TaxID=51671 RepID=UPI003A83A9A1
MEADTRLQRSLQELATLLDSVGESFWASWAANAAARVEAGGDPADVRRVYGGMTSVNDLVIHPMNGHPIPPGRVDEVNEALDELRTRIYAESVSSSLARRTSS